MSDTVKKFRKQEKGFEWEGIQPLYLDELR